MTMPTRSTTAAPRIADEGRFDTHDGESLFYRHWPAKRKARTRKAIVLFHRGHEHSARMAHLVDELALPEYDFFAWDARGHGQSPGARGFSPSLGTSVRDVQTFVDHLAATFDIAIENIAVIAQSVGAVLISTWVHDYAPPIRCMVLASPAFKVKLYVPLARPGLKVMQALRGNFFVQSYVKPSFLTHDKARIESYKNDPLIAGAISVNVLSALYDTADRIVADAQAIQVPTQLLISGSDFVVEQAPQHAFFDRLGTPDKEKHVFAGFFHDTLGERDRDKAVDAARRFIQRMFAKPFRRPSLLNAHETGFTKDEADRLAEPLPARSARGLYWAGTRTSLKIGSALSSGLRLGFDTGFDSGSTLDYVYRNRPDSPSLPGRLIDFAYLNSVGWRGIRVRKQHVEELLRLAMQALRDARKPVHVIDIAAGHGRYVLEAIESKGLQPDSITLRDYSEINVRDGNALVRAKKLGKLARFVEADAFDPKSIAASRPKPTLGVVSGLYELFPDNAMVRRSLSGLAAAIGPGGYLVYTGQPWHPQLEMIARALTSHRGGEAWVMRRRTQAEMDQLVKAAGFEKITQRIDEMGIFTVSLARRIG